jgi:hypothetical protein
VLLRSVWQCIPVIPRSGRAESPDVAVRRAGKWKPGQVRRMK